MLEFIGLLLLAAVWALVQYCLAPPPQLELLTLEQARVRPGLIWVDARNPLEYEEGHIPGAVNLPLREALQGIPPLLAESRGSIVVYCDGPTCAASRRVGEILLGKLARPVATLPGGMPEWKSANLPIQTGKAP